MHHIASPFALGMRRTRYPGLQKTHFHHLATAMVINLQRFVDWVWEIRVRKRASHTSLGLRLRLDSPTTSRTYPLRLEHIPHGPTATSITLPTVAPPALPLK